MPHCCDPIEPDPCQEAISHDEASSHPSCTLLLFGSTVVACSIYHTADWLLRAHKEWFHHQCQLPLAVTKTDPEAKPLRRRLLRLENREKVSRFSRLKKRARWMCPGHSRPQQVQVDVAEPQGVDVDPPPLKSFPERSQVSKSFQRIARWFCCCFYLFSLRDELEEIEPEIDWHDDNSEIESHDDNSDIESQDQSRKIENHDQSRKIVRHNQSREIIEEEGEVTIIPFEQKEAKTHTANDEEPQQPGGRKSAREIENERIQQENADEKWKESVDLTMKRLVYSLAGGTIVALSMFRGCTTRWSIIALGAGLGLGLSLRDASEILHEPTKPV
ncbi:unnamed protein product [Calypogeia fissa]